jgi:hypothetical protein
MFGRQWLGTHLTAKPTGTEPKTLSCLSSRNVPVCARYEIPALSTISMTVIVLGEGARELRGITSFKARYWCAPLLKRML